MITKVVSLTSNQDPDPGRISDEGSKASSKFGDDELKLHVVVPWWKKKGSEKDLLQATVSAQDIFEIDDDL